ncbi:luciferin sulfotransferase-like isoform X2 [Maniola jurtina]|nr:luciferin sulfotransferase-like isoform X2 [Maniola jurtina]
MDKIKIKDFPYEIETVNPQENQELMEYLKGTSDYIRIGPKKYFLPRRYLAKAANIYNFPLSSRDTLVVTFPKSGTTLTQELVWLLGNNLDYEKAQSTNINERFPFLEITAMYDVESLPLTEHQKDQLRKSQLPVTVKELEEMPSPRFIKSHLPLSLLPPTLLDTTKVVYVARDPRDVAFSYYTFYKFTRLMSNDKDFETFWKLFISNNILWSPYFGHVLEAWEKRNHPNMLFLFYEDMVKDLVGAVRRVANFYEKTLSEEQINRLVDHLSVDNFKKNKSLNMEDMKELGIYSNDGAFIRKGKSGGWRDHFDAEMTAQADEWIAEHLRDTDFRFPHC